MKNDATQDQVRYLYDYDPETGVFRWKNKYPHARRIKIGDVAGSRELGGYLTLMVNGKPYKAHRIAWLYVTGSLPEECIDHVNGVRDDNRFSNLREATHSENILNKRLRKDNICGVKGVQWDERNKNWRVRVKAGGKTVFDKRFNSLEAADTAAREAREKVHGKFARH